VLTLQHWVRGLEEHKDAILKVTTPETYRIWRLYMAGSAYSFQQGRINVYQSLLLKHHNGRSRMPLTRSDWYA
jgi:cyclopropane-fatty-acyl-phospholipid synthase